MYLQRTLQTEIKLKSIGLHSGRKVSMTIKPAGMDEGIIFVRSDVSGENTIKADLRNVSDTTLATTIGLNGLRVATIEHLLSAFRGIGIDNAVVEVDSPEVPIMDGSALPFVNELNSVGTRVQNKMRKFLIITKEVSVSDAEGEAKLVPSDEFKLTYTIDYPHPLIGNQTFHMVFNRENYEKEICAARTFGFLKDVEYLQAKGLALGGSLNNAIVLDDTRIINKEGLRCPNELVKHKVLDAIGDLFLIGMPIIGHLIARKAGHRLHNLLIRKLIADKDAWIISHFEKGRKIESLNKPDLSPEVSDDMCASQA
jgi:UDP-3-O-[3-hydroxymyristoyl] N-acetylglucosamine deacetylase